MEKRNRSAGSFFYTLNPASLYYSAIKDELFPIQAHMLTSTFIHIQGIGLKKEAELWENGILNWNDLRKAPPRAFSPDRLSYIDHFLEESSQNLGSNPEFFTRLLPAGQHWRLFRRYRPMTAYLDIETTGLGHYCQITTISLYDGRQIKYYIQGRNLEDFPADLEKHDVIVTYNGKIFDVPVIEKYFGIKIRQAHIDLRYVLGNLGIKGGLKNCEKQLGLYRGELDGFEGSLAVILWSLYQKTGNESALETLLAYNILDTINLEKLMIEAYNRNLLSTPFLQDRRLHPVEDVDVPFAADLDLLAEIRTGYYPDEKFTE